MIRLPTTVVSLLNAQSGLITHAQASAGGLGDSQIRHLARSGRWTRVLPGTYAAFTGTLTDRQRAWAAVLAAGRGAALAAESAAWALGLAPELREPITVVVPEERRPRLESVRVLRSRTERRVHGSPPTVGAEDVVCAVASSWSQDQLTGLVSRLVRERRTTPARLRDAVQRRGTFPGRAALRALIDDVEDGAEPARERRYLRDVERRHGLPVASRQVRDTVDGRTVVRDGVYPDFGLVVELDGRLGHLELRDRFADLRRDRGSAEAGWVTLRLTWREVAGRPCEVAAQLGGLLADLGWRGRITSCGAGCGR